MILSLFIFCFHTKIPFFNSATIVSLNVMNYNVCLVYIPCSYKKSCTLTVSNFLFLKFQEDRMSKCAICTNLEEEREKTTDKDVKSYLDRLFKEHNDLQM